MIGKYLRFSGLRVTGTPKAAVICFHFMTKEISEVQVEVSKNKDADVSPARVKDALDSSGLPRLDSEPLD